MDLFKVLVGIPKFCCFIEGHDFVSCGGMLVFELDHLVQVGSRRLKLYSYWLAVFYVLLKVRVVVVLRT